MSKENKNNVKVFIAILAAGILLLGMNSCIQSKKEKAKNLKHFKMQMIEEFSKYPKRY